MSFLWLWLAATTDPILAEGIRSGGCSARGYLWVLGPGMDLSSQVCLPLSTSPGLGTGHSAHGYGALKCSALGASLRSTAQRPINHPDGPARALERTKSWAGGCGSLPAQWGWTRPQGGRSSLSNSSTPVLLCERKVLDSHCLPRDCRPLTLLTHVLGSLYASAWSFETAVSSQCSASSQCFSSCSEHASHG